MTTTMRLTPIPDFLTHQTEVVRDIWVKGATAKGIIYPGVVYQKRGQVFSVPLDPEIMIGLGRADDFLTMAIQASKLGPDFMAMALDLADAAETQPTLLTDVEGLRREVSHLLGHIGPEWFVVVQAGDAVPVEYESVDDALRMIRSGAERHTPGTPTLQVVGYSPIRVYGLLVPFTIDDGRPRFSNRCEVRDSLVGSVTIDPDFFSVYDPPMN